MKQNTFRSNAQIIFCQSAYNKNVESFFRPFLSDSRLFGAEKGEAVEAGVVARALIGLNLGIEAADHFVVSAVLENSHESGVALSIIRSFFYHKCYINQNVFKNEAISGLFLLIFVPFKQFAE